MDLRAESATDGMVSQEDMLMRSKHVIHSVLSLVCVSFFEPASALADARVNKHLRESFTLQTALSGSLFYSDTEYDELTLPSFTLNLHLRDDVSFGYAFFMEKQLNLWGNWPNEQLRLQRNFRQNPFGNRDSFELWGAEVFKSEVKVRLHDDDAIVGSNPSVAIQWSKGSVAAVYQSEINLGEEIGVMNLRAKYEMRKEPRPEYYYGAPLSVSPLDIEYEAYYLVELYKKF